MNRALLVAVSTLCTAAQLYAQDNGGWFYAQSHNTRAVDAKGVRHDASAYKGAPPWLSDRISGPAPEYPGAERALRHEGRVIVRLALDVKTGRVTKAYILTSSGYASLDSYAIAALSRWTWRPGRWKEIDLPVRFHITPEYSKPPVPGAARLPRS